MLSRKKNEKKQEIKIWSCKIGEVDADLLPDGADFPMRIAIAEAYQRITGKEPNFIFSGWGAKLTETERQCVRGKKKIE